MFQIKFIKENNLWYADLPEYIARGGKKEDCLMVANAPELIEKIIGENIVKDFITVKISSYAVESYKILLKLDYENLGWGYYTAYFDDETIIEEVGLCPVNAFVFGGKQPAEIYVIV